MKQVTQRQGFFNSRIASISYLRIVPQNWVYSLVPHRRYAARNFLSDYVWARRGQSGRDYASIYRGIVGDYPNAFFEIPLAKAHEFFQRLAAVSTDSDWLALRQEFLVAKNGENFWSTVDFYHRWMAANDPVGAGIFDLRDYDTWEIPPESSGH
jgi:Fatty acid cis/trans isomerase (CTI)